MIREIIPLNQIGSVRFSEDHIICNYPLRTYSELLLLSAQIRKNLKKYSTRKILIVTDDSFEFVATLFACWSLKCIPVIAPDKLPHTIKQLEDVVACIVSNSFNESTGKLRLLWKDCEETEPIKPFFIDSTTSAFELFTSGTTGIRKSIPKTFRQISNELNVLEMLWGEKIEDRISIGTVSHQHIYGLLFRLLWPLCRGTPFTSRASFYWEEIISNVNLSLCFIISSPTHLNHFSSFHDYITKNNEGKKLVLFSSGGPLNNAVSIDAISPPINPSIVLFGLILGNSFLLPKT